MNEEELQEALHNFQKDKISGLHGWLDEFFIGLLEILEEDLLRVVKESMVLGKVLAAFNLTFIALIPKKDSHLSFEEFHHLSLCNCIYKVITKVIARRVKELLAGRQIHEAIGVVEDGLHSIKTKNLKVLVIKIDLSSMIYSIGCT
jgi:hypothetical protein